MSSRTLRQDVSKIPVVMEPAAASIAETFVPKPTEPSSDESGLVEPASDSSRDDASAASGQPLSERERAVLTFEKQNWKYAGAKEQAIRDRFEMSASRYYQLLNGLLDRPEAQSRTGVGQPAAAVAGRSAAGQIRPGAPAPRIKTGIFRFSYLNMQPSLMISASS